jgi:hypothetical protein
MISNCDKNLLLHMLHTSVDNIYILNNNLENLKKPNLCEEGRE